MMNSVLQIINFAFKMMNFVGRQVSVQHHKRLGKCVLADDIRPAYWCINTDECRQPSTVSIRDRTFVAPGGKLNNPHQTFHGSMGLFIPWKGRRFHTRLPGSTLAKQT